MCDHEDRIDGFASTGASGFPVEPGGQQVQVVEPSLERPDSSPRKV